MYSFLRSAAAELFAAGWTLRRVTTDHGAEFKAERFRSAVRSLGAEQRFTLRPQSNGCVERVQRTILEECWRPAFARSLVPAFEPLRTELARYLRYFNYERVHTGRHTRGRAPADVVYRARKMHS